jgi:hypothetical protein
VSDPITVVSTLLGWGLRCRRCGFTWLDAESAMQAWRAAQDHYAGHGRQR